jgi:hypothetical protein
MQVTTAEDTPTYAHEAGKQQLDVAKRKALSGECGDALELLIGDVGRERIWEAGTRQTQRLLSQAFYRQSPAQITKLALGDMRDTVNVDAILDNNNGCLTNS